MAELLEYLVRLRGAALASAEVRGLADEMGKLSAEQGRVAASGDAAAASGGRMGGMLGMAGKGVAAIGVGVVAVGAAAVKASISFNHEMLRIRTDAGASTAELARMKKGVLDLTKTGASMGQTPNSLAAGLYHLESLGIRGTKALKALTLASQESAISGANLEETTTAMGAAMFTGIKGTGDLTKLMGTLNATVGAGNMRFQDLVEALGTGVLPSAKVAGLSIQDVSAALAVATDSGYRASSAAAQLGTAFHFLYAPTSKADAALQSIGLTHDSLANDMHKPRGLLVALTDLKDHLTGLSKVAQAQVLNAILPGGRGRILLTELTMLDRLKGKYDQINKTAGGFRRSVAAQRRDPQTQLRTSEGSFLGNLVSLGDVLTPVVLPALAAVINAGSKVLEWLTAIPGAIKDAVHWFDQLTSGSSGTGKALNAIGGVFSSLWSTAKSAFSGIGSTAHSVFGGSMVTDLSTIGKALVQFGEFTMKILGPPLRTMISLLGTTVRAVFNVIGGVIKIVAGLLTLDFAKAWAGVKQIIGAVISVIGGALKAVFTGALTPLLTGAKGVVDLVTAAFGFLISKGLQPVVNFIGGAFQTALTVATNVVNGILTVINAVISGINSVINGWNSVAGSIPGIGGSLTISTIPSIPLIGAGGTSPATPAAPSGPHHTVTQGGHHAVSNFTRRPSHTVNVAHPAAGGLTIHAEFHHPIMIDGREVARAHKREVIKAMAAGA